MDDSGASESVLSVQMQCKDCGHKGTLEGGDYANHLGIECQNCYSSDVHMSLMHKEIPRDDLHFATESGSKISNLEEEKIHFETEDRIEISATFQVSELHKPLLFVEENSDDDSVASSDPEEHTAMMYMNGKWLDQATIEEKAAVFFDWANKAITPEPTAKYHPEWNATELRVVDPYADEGVYAIIDEGANYAQ